MNLTLLLSLIKGSQQGMLQPVIESKGGQHGALTNSLSDNANDASIDLTVDFGFQTPVGVGNVVFTDGNANGAYDPGEGVNGVRVELYLGSQTPGTTVP